MQSCAFKVIYSFGEHRVKQSPRDNAYIFIIENTIRSNIRAIVKVISKTDVSISIYTKNDTAKAL